MNTWMILASFFGFVLVTVSAAAYLMYGRKHSMARRDLEIPQELARDPAPQSALRGMAVSTLQALGEAMPLSPESRRKIEKRLSYAGYRGAPAVTSYFGVKSASAVFFGLLVAGASVWNHGDATMVIGAVICGLGFGVLLPERFIDMFIKARNNRLRRALPSALDLMVMSLEAGQPLDQAILQASRGLERFSPDLSSELEQVVLKTRASKTRAESIRDMADRNSEPELRKFCALLLDSERFGSSLAPTLRQHTRYMRIRFRQRAQEAARKMTVKLVFPVFFLIFPAILVVTLGPAVLTMQKYFQDFAK